MRLNLASARLLLALSIAPLAHCPRRRPTQPDSEQMTIHVTVSAHNGDPVEGLTKDDFTLTDNKHPEPITGFQALTGTQTGDRHRARCREPSL